MSITEPINMRSVEQNCAEGSISREGKYTLAPEGLLSRILRRIGSLFISERLMTQSQAVEAFETALEKGDFKKANHYLTLTQFSSNAKLIITHGVAKDMLLKTIAVFEEAKAYFEDTSTVSSLGRENAPEYINLRIQAKRIRQLFMVGLIEMSDIRRQNAGLVLKATAAITFKDRDGLDGLFKELVQYFAEERAEITPADLLIAHDVAGRTHDIRDQLYGTEGNGYTEKYEYKKRSLFMPIVDKEPPEVIETYAEMKKRLQREKQAQMLKNLTVSREAEQTLKAAKQLENAVPASAPVTGLAAPDTTENVRDEKQPETTDELQQRLIDTHQARLQKFQSNVVSN